jgi:hypothetical protein
MTRKIFDWHPELNLFAKNISRRIKILVNRDGDFVLPEEKDVGFVDADDVAEYFYDNIPKNLVDNMKNVCIRPPWNLTWMEYSLPDVEPVSNDDEMEILAHSLLQSVPGGLQIGTYIFCYDVPEDAYRSSLKNDLAMYLIPKLSPDIDLDYALPLWKRSAELQGRDKIMRNISMQYECHSIQIMIIYMADRKRWFNVGYTILYLDENGLMIPNAGAEVVDPGDEYTQIIAGQPFFLTLGLLNCRNVEMKVVPYSGAQKKKFKKYGSPIITRRTLVIHPSGKRYEGSGTGTGLKKRWHMCRGHFKTFTEEAPLFGRVTGTFWWQPQVRGSKSLGEVHKDYQIERE